MQRARPHILSLKDDLAEGAFPSLPDIGFDAILGRSRLVLQDDALEARAKEFVKAAGKGRLRPFLRVTPQHFDLSHSLVQTRPDAFAVRHAARIEGPVDPRRSGTASGRALARIASVEAANHVREEIGQRLEALAAVGISGFVFEQLEAGAGNFYRALIKDLTARRPELSLIASTPGLPREASREMACAGFDYLFSSLGWWDFRSRWLIEEYEALRSRAPLIAQITHDAGRRAASPESIARLLISAAATGSGIVVPEELVERSDASAQMVRSAINISRRAGSYSGQMQVLSSMSAPVTAIVRGEGQDLRHCGEGLILLINPSLDEAADLDHIDLSAGCGLQQFEPITTDKPALSALDPGEARVLLAMRSPPVQIKASGWATAEAAAEWPRIIVERVRPRVADGDFPVKRVVGEVVDVEAVVYGDGHEQLGARLLYRPCDDRRWQSVPMKATGVNDVWQANFRLERLGRYEFAVDGWLDVFGGYRRDLRKKLEAGVVEHVDLLEGEKLIAGAVTSTEKGLRKSLEEAQRRFELADDDEARAHLLLSDTLAGLMAEADSRPFATRSRVQVVDAERLQARFSSWYELFPRSITDDKLRPGTLLDVIGELPRVRDMGFDTLYFTPIHPIGRTNRKGPNNTLDPAPDDPGSPYAIGSENGGHDAIHPQLGNFEDFRALVDAAHEHGLEIALDFAINCSPDHPWLKEHPGWFAWRPDGSMKYAENPPKKYQDIVNVDFYAEKAVPGLWKALRDVVLLWVENGVKSFRVDNPHTKPLPFWEWMIGAVRARHPEVIFLSEAFTRPNMMYRLAKIGFSQSYTYFTWRNSKSELTEYIKELTEEEPKEFFRPHFFVNTPDINPLFLQTSGRPGFQIRAALAATLSGLFGVYSGFELCESTPLPGREEYLDSEKFEIRPRSFDTPGNIIWDITLLNRLRRAHPALQTHLNTRFFTAWNDNIIYYGKPAPDGEEMILVAVLLDPHHAHEADFEVPLWEFGLPDHGAVDVEDLVTGTRFIWHGKHQRMRIEPGSPYRLWRIEPARPRHV